MYFVKYCGSKLKSPPEPYEATYENAEPLPLSIVGRCYGQVRLIFLLIVNAISWNDKGVFVVQYGF